MVFSPNVRARARKHLMRVSIMCIQLSVDWVPLRLGTGYLPGRNDDANVCVSIHFFTLINLLLPSFNKLKINIQTDLNLNSKIEERITVLK